MKSVQETATTAAAKSELLFVVGIWRSGTSLLQALLQRHPQVALMYEAEPFSLWPQDARAIWPADWPQRLECYNQTLTRHHLDASALPAPAPARDAALALFRAFAAQRGATIIGDKAPAYHQCLAGVAKVFPEARFIVIWRDPLDCCRSAARAGRKNRFFATRGIMTRMLFGAESLARGVERLQRQGAPVHEVVYGEFVADPESHLRRICEFIHIPFDARMLDLKGADLSVLPSGEHHDKIRSGRIEQTARSDDPLPPAFTAKGRRYAALWSGQFAHLGFCRALAAKPEEGPPGWAERCMDHTANSMWRLLDALKNPVFRVVPLSWWRRIRAATPRGQGNAPNRNGDG
jgi:hypothetical protein